MALSHHEINTSIPQSVEISELIDPTQRLVTAALGRVREGKIDNLGRQTVFLEHSGAGRLFQILDNGVKREGGVGGARFGVGGRIISVDDLTTGLFINGIQLGKEGVPETELIELSLPRNTRLVNEKNIGHLLRVGLPGIERLIVELLATERIEPKRWQEAITMFERRGGSLRLR